MGFNSVSGVLESGMATVGAGYVLVRKRRHLFKEFWDLGCVGNWEVLAVVGRKKTKKGRALFQQWEWGMIFGFTPLGLTTKKMNEKIIILEQIKIKIN